MSAPLDRKAAVFYGSCIDAAYTMYEKPVGDPLKPQKSADFPLDYELTAWIQMSDFAFNGRAEKKFYGFIAREKSNAFSHILAIRGTEGWIEWYDDAICFPQRFSPVPEAGYVHAGFNQIYGTLQVIRCPRPIVPGTMHAMAETVPQPLSGSFADQVEDLLESLPVPESHAMLAAPEAKHDFAVAGHSLGAALCTLYTMEHAIKKMADPSRKVVINEVCTFASPRVGMKAFVDKYDALPIDSWRIVNEQDIVPKVPPSIPFVLPYRHVGEQYAFNSSSMVKFDPRCWHWMSTYLHWLDPVMQKLDDKCKIKPSA